MFNDLFKRAQDTVDSAVNQAVNRLIMVVPFLVALGFGTAALAEYLAARYDPLTSNLVIAGGYAVIGLIIMLAMPSDGTSVIPTVDTVLPEATTTEDAKNADGSSQDSSMGPLDRDLLTAAMSSVAPMALPQLLRLGLRNLPLIIALGASAYLLTQAASSSAVDPTSEGAASGVDT